MFYNLLEINKSWSNSKSNSGTVQALKCLHNSMFYWRNMQQLFLYRTTCHIILHLSASKPKPAVKDNLDILMPWLFSSFTKPMWLCYQDFMAQTLPKCYGRKGIYTLWSAIDWVLSAQKWLHKCFHSSVITECENWVCLRWKQACSGESQGYKQSSFSLSKKQLSWN